MANHLTDLEIALLASGRGSRALRQSLSEHLGFCGSCRQVLAETIKAARPTTASTPETDHPDEACVGRILARLQAAHRDLIDPQQRAVIVPLRPLEEPAGDHAPPLAARPEPRTGGSLPALQSEDGSLLVRFLRSAGDGPLRAYLVRYAPASAGGVRIVFPARELAFTFDAAGEASLPGITEEDLSAGRIEIELRPIDS